MTGQSAGPIVVPLPTMRPGSASFADVYPGYGTSTAATGGQGATAERAALASGGAPVAVSIGPDFITRPAGWLVLGLVAVALLSYFDR